MKDAVYKCPICQQPGWSSTGLYAHRCPKKPDRARLTMLEISQARPVETAAAANPEDPIQKTESKS